MQKPTWNLHRYNVEQVDQMRRAVAAANALFQRPQRRPHRPRRQPRHEPLPTVDADAPHNVINDTNAMPAAPAVDPVPEPGINDTHIMPVALPMPAVDPESQIADIDTHTRLASLPMPATQGVQQCPSAIPCVIASRPKASFQLGQLVECPVDFPTAAPQVGQLLAPPVEPSMKDSVVETTTQPRKTRRRAGPGVAAPYIAYVCTHHQVALKTTQVRPPTATKPWTMETTEP
ncbi:hypothetical protein AC1031_018823 [Aphanomyces cochlioides]|nr:hypothetical protein AC1031_018823 [Aphanomyces cochlioides]